MKENSKPKNSKGVEMNENSKLGVNSSENSKGNSANLANLAKGVNLKANSNENSRENSANSVNLKSNSSSNSNSGSNFGSNLKAIFALPKWAKIFLVALTALAALGLVVAFSLKIWANDKIEVGEIVLKGIDRGAQTRILKAENVAEQEIKAFLQGAENSVVPSKFAYQNRLYFARLDFLLRSKVIAYIDIQGISWASGVDKNAVSDISSHNRWVKFVTTQDLLSQNFNDKNLGKVEYKMDFSPLVKTILKYYALIFALFILCIFGFNGAKRFSLESPKVLDLAQNLGFKLALATLVFIATLFILSTLGFLVHLSINAGYFYLALIASLAALLYKNPRKIPSLALYALAFGVAFALALAFYDSSFDGRAYHQLGIFYLANGWNPIYQKMADISALQQFLSHEMWIEHYLKFAETTQACVYKALGAIESGKALNYLFAFGAFCYGVSTLLRLKNISVKMAILIAFLAVFSPVVLMQICTYYIDGFLACGLAFLLLSVLDLEISRKNGENLTLKYAVFILALLATASIKLTGVGYAGFIGVAYLIYRSVFFGIKNSKGVFTSGVVAALLIVICNANPLITNQIQHGHFGYPLMGKDKIDIITGNQPIDFNGLNRFEKLGKSLFSATINLLQSSDKTTQLKIPFTISSADNKIEIDTRVAGFGWFFSGVLILCLLLFLTNPKAFCKKEFIFAQILVLGSCLINPECWWARYVPQMWLVPFVFVVYSYALNLKAFQRALRLAIVGFLLVNLSSLSGIFSTHYTKAIKKQLANLEIADEKVLIHLPYSWEKSFGVKLLERGYPAAEFVSKNELENLQNQGVKFYDLENVLDNYDYKKALWNVAPKDAK